MSESMKPAARARPGSVTISSYLLFLVALLFAISAIISLSTLGALSEALGKAYEGTSAAGAETIAVGVGAAGAVLQLLVAVALVVLGLQNNRGRNVSRIITWVLGGLAICCSGVGLGGSALNGMNLQSSGDLPNNADVQRQLNDALPGWLGPVSTTISVLSLLALLVAVILLALPASNEFFRKPQPGWEPPVPGSGYPGYPPTNDPGYPSTQPGYPPTNPPAPPTNPPGGQAGPPTHG